MRKRWFATSAVAAKEKWEAIIGIEIHGQINSRSKIFSPAPKIFASTPNTKATDLDAALPGSLPVFNEECLRQGIRTGVALGGKIENYSAFDRKHYFYCDLPAGYQITQQFYPLVRGGNVKIDVVSYCKRRNITSSPVDHLIVHSLDNPNRKRVNVGITRIHLEQDSAKSLHDQHPDYSLIDYNRSGIGLMEIVSEPDIRSPIEAAVYVQKVQTLLKHIGSCDANMEEGSMRCDINISVHKPNTPFGTRTEIKNLGSIRSVRRSIEYEIERHIRVLESGGKLQQETRTFDVQSGETKLLRIKESEVDYRFFPEPDLPPIRISGEYIDSISHTLPELPDQIYERYVHAGIPSDVAMAIIDYPELMQFFETIVAKGRPLPLASQWVITELLGRLITIDKNITESPVNSDRLGALIDLIASNEISGKIGKQVLDKMFEGDEREPEKIIQSEGWTVIVDSEKLTHICQDILSKNPEKVAQFTKGENQKRIMKFFMGQAMQVTSGRAQPDLLQNIFDNLIKKIS